MITIFRKIRQRFLSEQKFTTYLLYAMGEIILVVIGILIALQINNWNEDRKAQIAQKDLLINLYDNLGADTLVLQENRQAMLRIIETQRKLHALRKGQITADVIENPHTIRGSIRNYSITQTNHPEIAANIFDEELKEQIREYYRLLASLENAYIQYDTVVKQVVRPYLADNLTLNPDFLFENQEQFVEPDQPGSILNLERFYQVIKKEDFGQILFESNLKAMETIDFFDVILTANEALRLSIQNEIQ